MKFQQVTIKSIYRRIRVYLMKVDMWVYQRRITIRNKQNYNVIEIEVIEKRFITIKYLSKKRKLNYQ